MIYTEMLDIDKQALKNNTCAIKTKLIVLPDGEHEESIVLTEENSVKDWTYDDDRIVPDEGFIGQFVARTLSGNLQDVSEDFNIENRMIELQMAIVRMGSIDTFITTENNDYLTTEDGSELLTETSGSNETWYSLGTFYVTKPENDDVSDNTKFEALDKTILFNQDFNYNYVSQTFPLSFDATCKTGGSFTALELAKYTCEQIGVSFGSKSFTNATFKITSNQFVSGDSCRDVMKAIAQLAYSWVYIDWDDKCYIPIIDFDTKNISDLDTLDNNEYFSLVSQKNTYGPINKVLIGLSAVEGEGVQITDDESIKLNGINEIDIFDNPITYTDILRANAISAGSILFGLEYTPLTTETIGHPWFKGHKIVCIKDMDGNKKYTLPLNNEIKYSGHIRSTFTSTIDTKTQERLGYNRKLFKDLKDVKITLDKQEGTIKTINKSVTALDDGLKSLEKSVSSITTDSYTRTEVQEIVSGVGVDGVVVTSVKTAAGTFDLNGLTIEQSDADTKTNINANGMIIYDATGGMNDALLTVNKDGVIAKNIRVQTYLNIGQHSRIEDYTSPDYIDGTGVFWIGSE